MAGNAEFQVFASLGGLRSVKISLLGRSVRLAKGSAQLSVSNIVTYKVRLSINTH